MQIVRARIRNFRCHVDTEIHFEKHHALVGINSSGKTAVLEAIALALSAGRSVSEHDFNNQDLDNIRIEVELGYYFLVEVDDGYTTQYVPCNGVTCEVKRREKAAPNRLLSDPFRITSYATPVLYEPAGGLDLDAVPDGYETKIPSAVRSTPDGYQLVRRGSGNAMGVRRDRVTLANETIDFPNIFYFSRDRERQTKTGFNTTFTRITKELNWRYRDKHDEDIKSASPPPAVTSVWDPYYHRVIGAVTKRMELLEDVQEGAERLLGRKIDGLELSLLDLEQPFSQAFWAIRDGANQIEIEETGSGLSVLLAYCLLTHISDYSKETVIFLIDEPELHLHPELQKRLASELRNADKQVIYTTHSPFFVDLGHWRGTTRFEADGIAHPQPTTLALALSDGRTIQQHLDDIRAGRYHESAFIDSDAQLLLSQRVLLVEGPADRYGIPRLAKKLGEDIDSLTVIACNGKTMICHYALLCLAYDVKAFVVFDRDRKPETHADNSAVISTLGSIPHESFTTSLEALLGVSGERKAFKVLERIEAIEGKDIPAEVVDVVEAVIAWHGGKKKSKPKRKTKESPESAASGHA